MQLLFVYLEKKNSFKWQKTLERKFWNCIKHNLVRRPASQSADRPPHDFCVSKALWIFYLTPSASLNCKMDAPIGCLEKRTDRQYNVLKRSLLLTCIAFFSII